MPFCCTENEGEPEKNGDRSKAPAALTDNSGLSYEIYVTHVYLFSTINLLSTITDTTATL